ncbi:ABC transporter substrate-binding protein [Streptomyces millisiae]|uniref:ABC transporter substrate-binding protein n=1 Tax=Streptomyces millisiae TaxID=3075542 RepID=A0ABU2LIP8_9ACTN|nr:ABC transporter substrate-binding protein [Streptomyces sp. DSM 44918]MDT0317008.1 ABC transporter substrate-binding protein [Streptomyces sp. DSM 44918]
MSLTKRARWRRPVLAAAAAAMLASAGCSAATQGPGAAGAAGDDGTLVVAQAYDVDPGSFLKTAIGNIVVEYSVFETLTLIDPETTEPRGVLAESWELAPDATSMSITLRDDVTFHSGRRLTSADVAFTLEQAQDPSVGAANQSIAAQISEIRPDGDHGLELTFAQPLPNVFDLFETLPILNEDAYDDYAAGRDVDGTGRFRWESWTPGGEIVLSRYDEHRDAENTELDGIQIDVITDPTALTSAIRSGRAQYAVGLPPGDARSLGEQPGFELVATGGAAFPVAFDVTQQPFDDPAVRRAVQYAIDRDRIVEQVEGGHGVATSVPWRSTTVGYDEAQAAHYSYDPDRAEELLAEAGVAPGTSFEVAMGDTPEATGIFQIVQNNLADVGLNAEPVILNGPDYEERLATRNFSEPVVLMQAGNGLSPASAVVSRPELVPANNVSGFETAEYDALVDAVTSASSPEERERALREFNDYFIDQAFAVPLISRPTLSVRTEAVSDIVATQMGFLYIAEASLSD